MFVPSPSRHAALGCARKINAFSTLKRELYLVFISSEPAAAGLRIWAFRLLRSDFDGLRLNSVSASRATLISSKSRVYLLKDRDPVGRSASRWVGFRNGQF